MQLIVRASLGTSKRRAALCGAALGVLGLSLSAPTAHAASDAYVDAQVQCDAAGHGVLDLTLVNDGPAEATFAIIEATSAASPSFAVAPGAAYAVTQIDLPDGVVTVRYTIDGVESSLSAQVECALPRVESMAATPRSGVAAAEELPRTGSSLSVLSTGAALVLLGGVASSLTRRRPA